MTIIFSINYHTNWGQRLFVCGSVPELGKNVTTKAIPMEYIGNGEWKLVLTVKKAQSFTYKYLVFDENTKTYTEEYMPNRTAIVSANANACYLDDTWRSNGVDKTFYSAAFTEGLIARSSKSKKADSIELPTTIRFTLSAPRIAAGYQLAILGSCDALGNWDTKKALVLSDAAFPLWQGYIDATDLNGVIDYKYVIYDSKKKMVVSWEEGENRTLDTAAITGSMTYNRNDEVFRYGIAPWKCTGVAIPVFSLRTNNSFGIGEFSDLRLMSDWAKETGQKIIQTLPITDTTRFRTNADSYPYSSITVMGLHPIYLNIFEMGILKDAQKMEYFYNLQKQFNASPTVMYQEVGAAKWEYFRLIFKQEGKKVMASAAYKKFVKENAQWLYPYAAFCYLRDANSNCNFHNWGKYAIYNEQQIMELFTNEDSQFEANLHIYLQYNAHIQLLNAVKYAKANGVVLKGDIPIGISPESVEAWMEPELFNLDSQAGAPPDPFSKTGQNWGFPTYNWEAMERDGYAWWKKRFQKMATYFQVYRIDHVLGFFRIWRMSSGDVQGLLGYFDPALPMHPDEMRNNFGVWFDYDRMVRPYIREHVVNEKFGDLAGKIKNNFLDLVSSDTYAFKEDFNTQRKIEAFAKEHPELLDIDGPIYNELLALHGEVLFIEDKKKPGHFHPRITLQETCSYRDLDWGAKEAINNLYNHFYYHRHNEFWKEQAMKKLPALLRATNMLVCAEDLGMIPDCVPHVMSQLYMLSLEIDRMPKDPTQEFVNMGNVPYLSVCTTSTHDMAPIRGWWQEDKALIQRYYNYILGEWGEAKADCEPWICEKIVARHLHSPAMLVILPFQDWMSIDGNQRRANAAEERINIPSDPHHFWCYRMHKSVEELLQMHELNARIKQLGIDSGRSCEM